MPDLPTMNPQLKTLKTDSLKLSSDLGALYLYSLHSLETLEPGWLPTVMPDSFLMLESNPIGEFSEEIFRNILETLSQGEGSLDIWGNPLHCDCSIKWLVEEPDLLNVVTKVGNPTCEDSTLLADLLLEDFTDCP